ncbi:MAG: NifU family protein [Patescibacteria group bacterium]|nr:NifU family protein [Patescibacteria group bacterium]
MSKNDAKLREELEAAIEELRGGLKSHGGNVELVDVNGETGLVKIRMQGACVGCPMSEMTVKYGIESELMEKFDWIMEVRQVK